MPDLLEGGPGFLGSGWGCAGWRWRRRWFPEQWAFRCLSSISLLSAEDMGRGSTRDQGLAKQVGPCCLAHAGGVSGARPAGGFSALALLLSCRSWSPSLRCHRPLLGGATLMPAEAQPQPAASPVQEPGLTVTGQC